MQALLIQRGRSRSKGNPLPPILGTVVLSRGQLRQLAAMLLEAHAARERIEPRSIGPAFPRRRDEKRPRVLLWDER